MPNATESGLKVEQLKRLSNDAVETHRQLESVLWSLAGSDEEAQWACEALENCGAPANTAAASLVAFTQHPSELVASWACKLLGRLGPAAACAEKPLIAALSQRSEQLVQEEAAHALGELGNLSGAARAALTVAASQGGPRLKRLATASLGG